MTSTNVTTPNSPVVQSNTFAVLRRIARRDDTRGLTVACREPGTLIAQGTLTIAAGRASFHNGLHVGAHAAAANQAAAWLGDAYDGDYPATLYRDHHSVVGAQSSGLCLMDDTKDYGLALALGWAAALVAAHTGDARQALAAAGRLYIQCSDTEQDAILAALMTEDIDAGGLFALYLTRVARESADEEWERWASWYLGQQQVDLPYNRRAVVDILESDIDPDQKRLDMHDVLVKYDAEIEQANRMRIVDQVRRNNMELVFGRMSRAFHNQSLLFANASYVQIDDAIRVKVAALAADCLTSSRLSPAADRLRTLLQGATETGMTGAIGALELLENAILDDGRAQIDGILKANREGRPLASGLTTRSILAHTDALLEQCRELRDAIQAAPRRPAAFVLLSQRLAPLESHLMVRINELQEPFLGKPDNLKTLVRQGGERMYSSPDYAWLQYADHWVEAIPLFIKERVLIIDGVEVTETVIDQQILEETFREQFADHWALGLDNVMDSEHVALARELFALHDARFSGDDRARAAATAEHGLAEGVGALAAMIAFAYRTFADMFHQRAERDGLSRYDTLRATVMENICNDHPHCLVVAMIKQAAANDTSTYEEAISLLSNAPVLTDAVRDEATRLAAIAHLPRRALPALHVLTTQSARMSDSYVRTWLEESMALFNVIRAHDLTGEVQQRMAGYRERIMTLGARLIRELGMWAEVEEVMALENLPENVAVSRIVAGNMVISNQLAILAVFADLFGLDLDAEAPLVEELLHSQRAVLHDEAIRAVYARNDLDLLPKMDAYRAKHPDASEQKAIAALVADNPEYAEDLEIFIRFAAREAAVRELDRRDPALQLAAQVRDWLRNHSRLALTTARREVLLEHGLNHLTMHPLYYYRAAGGNKRFHQLYTPSRVDLGIHERESVETWSQWVGGADKEASRAGRRVFALINKNPKMFDSLTEPEVIKTGENASMVAHFSYSNAMSLLVNSVGRGDIEELGDQMNLRKDRHIHPGGEGYGGYCVPKDGLFLAFVLILTRATKLRQLGVADHLHAGVVKFAHFLLSKRGEFAGETLWEAWAMQLVADKRELEPFFTVRDSENGVVPIFQITRIARALTQLGRPELTDAFDVLSNLAARWGIHKVIVGGEQVNRFMPFYKVWSTYRMMEEAQRLNPDVKIRVKDFCVVLSAEYKPNTQDGRYSVGMRKYELFAGTGDHLMFSLDGPGQDLAHLMFHGFASLWERRHEARINARVVRLLSELSVREDDELAIAQLHRLYPGEQAPGEIRMVSPMMLTTSDLLHYTSDTQLEQLAMEAKRRLQTFGLLDSEITANMQVYGPHLHKWTKLRGLPAQELSTLNERIGGAIHALALSIIGPAGNYEMAVQGSDVLDTGIPHDSLLAVLDDPVKLRDMMLMGNPNSALAIIDGASGARHRAMNRLAVMRWFASGEAVGRNALYRCMGVGAETIENWRADMRYQRARAKALYDALACGDAAGAQERFDSIVTDLREGQESALFLEMEERMMRFRKRTAQEEQTARAISSITAGLTLKSLDFGAWLALGGQFLVIGESPARFTQLRDSFDTAIAALFGKSAPADEQLVSALYVPAFIPAQEEFREEKGIESSNKATEEVAVVAMDTRKRLAERVARARAMCEREQALLAVLDEQASQPFDALVAAARASLGDGKTISSAQLGRLLGLMRLAFIELGHEIFSSEAGQDELHLLTEHMTTLFTGRDVDMMAIRAVSGGYEDPGDIARMANAVAADFREGRIAQEQRDRLIGKIADAAELFDTAKAILFTMDFMVVPPGEPMAVWRAMADFFAESLNDHFFQYAPWVYSRGDGFTHLTGDALYELSVRHHGWLYAYLRNLILTMTEMRERSPEEVAHLLGDMADAASLPAIGADADSAVERQWRAYNQLREIIFLRNDGFPLPQVFTEFDPAIIHADKRTNLVFLYPVARTHVSRAIMEGPTLAKELEAQRRPGANLLITRDGAIVDLPGARRPVLQVHNAHLYISRAEYQTALQQHRGLSPTDAEILSNQHAGPKGVRVAARFTAPVTAAMIFPMHGQPKYISGQLEELGLPYSSQSLFHTWTTYDKAKYPDIFHQQKGVEIPGEIDWLATYTTRLSEAEARHALEFGNDALPFAGLRAFAQRFNRIMVKGAAESGGRGQRAFTVRTADGIDEAAIGEAVDFTYTLSLVQNVAIQEVIIASPEHWATEEFMQSFVDRQVQEWDAVVVRNRRPRTSIYGSHRLVYSTDNPGSGEWHVSHPITLNSRQLITNVGRGGTLDLFRKEFIRPEFREQLWQRMVESGEKCMNALSSYAERTAAQYVEESGHEIGEDATGLSYAFPRYMMLDFLVQPRFAEEGILVDMEPIYNADGERIGANFILQRRDERFAGTVKDWRVVLIEPNIGIGLWDRLAIREEFYFVTDAETPDWSAVGANARVVLRDMAKAGEDYLQAVLGR